MKILILMVVMACPLFGSETKEEAIRSSVGDLFSQMNKGGVSPAALEKAMVDALVSFSAALDVKRAEITELRQNALAAQRENLDEEFARMAKMTEDMKRDTKVREERAAAEDAHRFAMDTYPVVKLAEVLDAALAVALEKRASSPDADASEAVETLVWAALKHLGRYEAGTRDQWVRLGGDKQALVSQDALGRWQKALILGDEIVVKVSELGLSNKQKIEGAAWLKAREVVRSKELVSIGK